MKLFAQYNGIELSATASAETVSNIFDKRHGAHEFDQIYLAIYRSKRGVNICKFYENIRQLRLLRIFKAS